VLRGLWAIHFVRAELHTARELGEQLLTLTHDRQQPAFLLEVHHTLGGTLCSLGEFSRAREHLERSMALYDPEQHRSQVALFGPDVGVFCRAWAAHSLWHLGFPDQAVELSAEALALAQELDHPFSLALAQAYAAMLHQFRRERQATTEYAEASYSLSTQYGFPYYAAWAEILRNWALAQKRPGTEEVAQLRQAVTDFEDTGSETRRPFYLGLIAEVCAKAGRLEEGLEMLDEALATSKKNGDCWWDAELHRLKGELLLVQGADESEVEVCFQRALDIARQQQTRSLELRAAISLCRLWQSQASQGKSDQARKLLSEVYDWFTEGFETADLKEAETLLNALS
jgi:predicted ATPase